MIETLEIKDSKYIFNTWREFTTLTEKEQENLKEILKFNKLLKRRKKILWITLK